MTHRTRDGEHGDGPDGVAGALHGGRGTAEVLVEPPPADLEGLAPDDVRDQVQQAGVA